MAIERPRLRAVFDTNVVIAALKSHSAHSPTAELLRRWEAGEFDLLYSADLRAEYEETFAARAVDPDRAQSFLDQLQHLGISVEVLAVQPLIAADPDDDIVLACALTGQASHLVTYDPHILSLGEEYHAVRMIDGLHFLYLVRGDVPPQA